MNYRQGFVNGAPDQPTAESALAIKCPNMAKRREQAVLYSFIGSVRIAKHPVCDSVEQAAILRCPKIRRHTVVRRILPYRNSFL